MFHEHLSYYDYIFSAATILENRIYFFSEKENALMEIDINNWKMKYVEKFIKYNFNIDERTDLLRNVGKVIFRLPLKGEYVEVFSIDDGLYQKIKIKQYNKDWDNFIAFEVTEKFIYIFPKWEKEILKINLLSHKVDVIPLESIHDDENNCLKFTNFSASYRENNLLWLFEEENFRVCIYNMDKDLFYYRNIPLKIASCTCFCKVDKNIYFLTINEGIYVWNTVTDESFLLWKGESYRNVKYYFTQIVVVLDKIIVLPGYGNDIVIIDCKSGFELHYNNYPKDFCYLDIKWGKYLNCFEDERYYYYPMRLSAYLMAIDKETGEIIWNKVITPLSIERVHYLQTKLKNKQTSILHEGHREINLFFDILKELDKNKENISLRNGLGNVIWKGLKSNNN